MHIWYKLDGHNAVPCDMMDFAESLERSGDDRRVAYTEFDDCRVSTVFLGIDHSFGDGPPLLFETMVFPNNKDGLENWADMHCRRYSTWEEAEAGHYEVTTKIILEGQKVFEAEE
jgi:hypothetical protein